MSAALLAFAVLATGALPKAHAQDFRFPGGDDDYGLFSVSAYMSHDDLDYDCGPLTESGKRATDFIIDGFEGMDEGRSVVAAAEGVVVGLSDGAYDRCDDGACGTGNGYGNYVTLRHADGRETLYANLATDSVTVALDQRVACGDELGLVGSSGNSTEPHLGFAVRDQTGRWADPFLGECSETEASMWVDQGAYESLPAALCDAPVACRPAETLTCGASAEGNTGGNGHTQEVAWYGCTDWLYTGPELAYAFATNKNEPVTVTVSGLTDDLDLYVLADDGCAAETCVVYSAESESGDELVNFEADAGVTYTLVLDGYEGASSSFSLTTACNGSLPVPDTGDSGDSSGPDIDTGPFDTSDPWGPLSLSSGAAAKACGGGCDASVTPAALALAALAAALGRRRQAR